MSCVIEKTFTDDEIKSIATFLDNWDDQWSILYSDKEKFTKRVFGFKFFNKDAYCKYISRSEWKDYFYVPFNCGYLRRDQAYHNLHNLMKMLNHSKTVYLDNDYVDLYDWFLENKHVFEDITYE